MKRYTMHPNKTIIDITAYIFPQGVTVRDRRLEAGVRALIDSFVRRVGNKFERIGDRP